MNIGSNGFNIMRLMQIAMGTTIILTIIYMWQFMSINIMNSFPTHRLHSLRHMFDQKHVILEGFDAGYKFVGEYDVQSQGDLYIFIVSGVDSNGTYWCPDCIRAKEPVYNTFRKAPAGSRLVEIRVGSSEYWEDENNEFRQNQLFYIDYIPTLMRYDGGGNTSMMLAELYCADINLLENVMRVPNPTNGPPKNNTMITLHEAKDVMAYLDNYDNSYPLFIQFLSGFHSFNGRLWCPYCDKAEVAITYYFKHLAPENAIMLRAVVAPSYLDWKKKTNGFKQPEFRQYISIRGVPHVGQVWKDMNGKIKELEFMPEFDQTALLTSFFGHPRDPQVEATKVQTV